MNVQWNDNPDNVYDTCASDLEIAPGCHPGSVDLPYGHGVAKAGEWTAITDGSEVTQWVHERKGLTFVIWND